MKTNQHRLTLIKNALKKENNHKNNLLLFVIIYYYLSLKYLK